MPSPVGHALGGIAAGWLVSAPSAADRRMTAVFAALAVAPDLDLLASQHRGPTHSIGAALLVGLVAWILLRRTSGNDALRLALACAAAYGSHILLDLCGADTSPPYGLTALWPFSHDYYEGPWPIFNAVSRRYRQPDLFWIPNVVAVVREVLILAPIVAVVGYWRRRGRGGSRAAVTSFVLAGAVIPTLYGAQRTTIEHHPPVDGPYNSVVVRYCSGEFEGAIADASTMPESAFKELSKDLRKDVRARQCAAMLHTEIALALPPFTTSYVFHFAQARGFLVDLERNPQPGEFVRQWYLYVSAALQAAQSLEEVHGHLIAARKRFPTDADVLASSAAEYESYARIGSAPPPIDRVIRLDLVPGHAVDVDVKSALETAASWLSGALAASPDHEEAHLRLGRVLTGLGQFDRAAEHLEIVRRQIQDPNLKYLALLFLAAAEHGLGHQPRAIALYADALRLFPGQAGFLGLSEAFYEDGRMVEARTVLLRALDATARSDDPWFAYPLGDGWRTKVRLQTVRELAIK
jgi:membrane-bound metal-dependent hydrolase YbcI (DUF457 family)/tetratricopeptide (TPR) repeat protein